MTDARKKMIEALQGHVTEQVPFWLMRQAGRYLPEYRELRAKAGSFLNLCFNPPMACEITLQPLRRFDMDAAILFSDILVIPLAMGMPLEFTAGEGPKLDAVQSRLDVDKLVYDEGKLSAVFETLGLIKKELHPEKTLIGFAGAPFTVACYMIDGKGGGFAKTRALLNGDTEILDGLIAALVQSTTAYLCRQIEAGADCVQIFDSWAGMLDDLNFEKYAVQPVRDIVDGIRRKYPEFPVIGFPRGCGNRYAQFAKGTGVSGMSVGQEADIKTVAQSLQGRTAVQGNLDPELLLKGGADMEKAIVEILEATKDVPFIFNIGHGVIKETPVENVAVLACIVKEFKR
jgi:uroporphyrinogen decarboxylase